MINIELTDYKETWSFKSIILNNAFNEIINNISAYIPTKLDSVSK